MNVWEWLLLGVVGWTGLGVTGVLISLVRGERAKVRQGSMWLVGVMVLYIASVIGVSMVQPQRVIPMGQEQCFDEMCFAVTRVEEVPQFFGKTGITDGSRLVRITVLVENKGHVTQGEGLIRAYLLDQQGGRWPESNGVNGNGLTTRVPGGGTIVSEPVFKVGPDAAGLRLVFTRGHWQPGVLVIGDSDSLGHRRTVMALER